MSGDFRCFSEISVEQNVRRVKGLGNLIRKPQKCVSRRRTKGETERLRCSFVKDMKGKSGSGWNKVEKPKVYKLCMLPKSNRAYLIFLLFSKNKMFHMTWTRLKPHSGLSCSDILTYLKYLLCVYISFFLLVLFCFSLHSTEYLWTIRIKDQRQRGKVKKTSNLASKLENKSLMQRIEPIITSLWFQRCILKKGKTSQILVLYFKKRWMGLFKNTSVGLSSKTLYILRFLYRTS